MIEKKQKKYPRTANREVDDTRANVVTSVYRKIGHEQLKKTKFNIQNEFNLSVEIKTVDPGASTNVFVARICLNDLENRVGYGYSARGAIKRSLAEISDLIETDLAVTLADALRREARLRESLPLPFLESEDVDGPL